MSFKYFVGDEELAGAYPMRIAQIKAVFPAVEKLVKTDSFSAWVGNRHGQSIHNWIPVTRVISYKENGTKHECDSRCRCAKGGNCECSCGGKFHGIDR